METHLDSNKKLFPINSFLLSSTLLVVLTALAISSIGQAAQLGAMKVNSSLGESFSASIPLRLSSGESIGPGCVGIAPSQSAEANASAIQDLNIRMLDGGNPKSKTLIITSDSRVLDPAVRLAVRVGCDSSVTREFMAFLDPPIAKPTVFPEAEKSVEEPLRFKLSRSNVDDRGDQTSLNSIKRSKRKGEQSDAVVAEDGTPVPKRLRGKKRADDALTNGNEREPNTKSASQSQLKQFQLSDRLRQESLSRVEPQPDSSRVVAPQAASQAPLEPKLEPAPPVVDASVQPSEEVLKQKLALAEAETARQIQLAKNKAAELSNEKARLADMEENSISIGIVIAGVLLGLVGGLSLAVFGVTYLRNKTQNKRKSKMLEELVKKVAKPPSADTDEADDDGLSIAVVRKSPAESDKQPRKMDLQMPAADLTRASVKTAHKAKPGAKPVVSHNEFESLREFNEEPTKKNGHNIMEWESVGSADHKKKPAKLRSPQVQDRLNDAFELEEVRATTQSASETFDLDSFAEHESLENEATTKFDNQLQESLDWLHSAAQSQLFDSNEIAVEEAWRKYVQPADWLSVLFDSAVHATKINAAAESLKAHLIADNQAPLSVWALWMCWLKQSGRVNVFNALTSRFQQRFGINFPSWDNLSLNLEAPPDVMLDVIEMMQEEAGSRMDKKRLILGWLADKSIPQSLITQPKFYLSLFKRVRAIELQSTEQMF